MPRLSLVLKYLRCAGKTVHALEMIGRKAPWSPEALADRGSHQAGAVTLRSCVSCAKWIMCCAAAAQSVTIDGVDRSSPTPKSINYPHDGAHDEERSAVRIHLFQ